MQKWCFSFGLLAFLSCCSYNSNIQNQKQTHKEKTITVESLRNELWRDSTHCKVMMFYDPWCLPCVMNIDSFIQPLISTSDTAKLKFWLISDNHLFEEESNMFLTEHGIPISKVNSFNLNDTCKVFTCMDYNQWDNVANFIFNPEKPIHGLCGLPFYLIADKHNTLLIKDNIDSLSNEILHLPIQLYELKNQ
jgi:hypothetical protein